MVIAIPPPPYFINEDNFLSILDMTVFCVDSSYLCQSSLGDRICEMGEDELQDLQRNIGQVHPPCLTRDQGPASQPSKRHNSQHIKDCQAGNKWFIKVSSTSTSTSTSTLPRTGWIQPLKLNFNFNFNYVSAYLFDSSSIPNWKIQP